MNEGQAASARSSSASASSASASSASADLARDVPALSLARRRDRLVTAGGCLAILLAGLLGYFAFETDLAFLTRLVCAALFVMSLDLVTGYCGIATLGHAALYGAGAYGAGIAAVHGLTSPLAMLGVAILAGALAGAVSGFIILRAIGLTQLVLSIAVGELASAFANKASGLTGGSDGLAGITPDALFGRFEFDLFGHTAYVLSVVCLIIAFALLRMVVTSPFGLLCRGIREDRVRAAALGAPVRPPLFVMYVVAGATAGLAGGLAALATGVVGLDSFGFERSAVALVMLVLGGIGTLFGALIGTAVFEIFQSIVSAANPFHWLTLVGLLLIAVVLFIPRGLQSLFAMGLRALTRARAS